MSEHELWNELGNLYFLSGEYGQAVFAYKRAIQMDEHFGRPYSNLALTYVQQGKYDQAIDLYRRSIELLAENREKAISWNRLGNVYRHLKDYRQAVEAYRQADELDPENGEGGDKPGWLTEGGHGMKDRPAVTEAAAVEEPYPYAAPKADAPPAAQVEEVTTATWAPIDPTLFQQDTFEALDPGALTTWGDPGPEVDESDTGWPPDPETEVYYPETESDDLSKWLPIPEERPLDSLEYTLEAVDLAAEIEEPLETASEPGAAGIFADLQPEPPDPIREAAEAPKTTEVVGLLPQATETQTPIEASERKSVTTTEIDVIVQERTPNAFVVAGQADEMPVTELEHAEAAPQVQEEAAAIPEPEAATETVVVPGEAERDPDELREIEAGLAKFRRVVQLNPKNARAWDTLGNLHKAAGQYKEALLAYQRATENDPSKALFHHHLGLVYACEGRIDDAIEAFQRVIEIDPDHALAHATLGGYYRKKGLEELAQKHVGIAMKSIFDSENEYNRACLAAICGNTDQALELLRIALKNRQTYVDWILRDPDLDFIRQDPRFKQLISDYAR